MSYGLRVWDAAGNVTVDITDRLTRIHGVYTLNVPANVSGWRSFPIPGLTLDGTWGALIFYDFIAFRLVAGNFQIFVTTPVAAARSYPFTVFRC